jgi:TolB-like protein
MTLQIQRDSTKFDIHAGHGDLVKVLQLLPKDRGRSSTFRGTDPVRPGVDFLSLNGDNLTIDQKLAIQKELQKVLQSSLLVQSNRLSRFLSFAVETTLMGNGDSLKEYTIGIEAYERRQDFEPSQDSIVRTEARRLRTKLKQYYQEEGEDDPIFIYFRPGSYIPVFHVNQSTRTNLLKLQTIDTAKSSAEEDMSISVVPFSYLTGDALAEACARGLTDELMHCLTQSGRIRVFACPSYQTSFSKEARLDNKRGICITCEGSVRTEGPRIRVTSRLYDSEGLHTASWRFNAEINPDELFGALEKIASEIEACIASHRAGKAGS